MARRPSVTSPARISAVLTPIVALGAIALAGCGVSARHGLSVTPVAPRPTSTLRFQFTAPESSGRHGQTQTGYTLIITGPERRGCVGVRSDQLPAVARDELVTVNVTPSHDGHWCTGSFMARVQEVGRPVCAVGTMCPQFVRLLATVGEVRFSIAG
jgi:hypothetical protein